MDTYSEKVTAEIDAYASRLGLSRRALARELGWTPSKLAMKLSGARKWSVIDLDDLEAEVKRLMHYFLTYKNLPNEPAKCRIQEVYGAEHAREVIKASQKDYANKFGG